MINYNFSIRHAVETGILKENKLRKTQTVGEVHRCIKRGYFKLYLNVFPGITYYVVKDDVRDDVYRICSKIIKTEDGYDFENEIGTGELLSIDEKESYIKILIPVLKLKMFMDWNSIEESDEVKAEEVDHRRILLQAA